jgi:hypothetical protein
MILSVATFFAFIRILMLFRSKRMPILLFLSLMIPEVVNIYCFAVRNKRIYTKLPVFGMPPQQDVPNETPSSFTEDDTDNAQDDPSQDDRDDERDKGNGDDDMSL